MKISRIYSSLLVAAIAGVFLASSAQAEDWFFMVESSDAAIKFFLDRDSITRTGKFSEVNTFDVWQKPEKDGTIAMLVRREYSCQEKKSRVKRLTSLFDDQSMRVYKDPTAWEAVKADSVDNLILQKVCNVQ